MGVREQIIFPEIDYDAIDQVRGLDITITTTAATDVEAFALLTALGMPFSTYGRPAGFNEAVGYVPEEDTRPGSKPAPASKAEPEPAAEAEPEPAAETEPEAAAEAEPRGEPAVTETTDVPTAPSSDSAETDTGRDQHRRDQHRRAGGRGLMAKTSMRVKQARPPKFKTRAYTRCNRCGRPRAVYRKFGLCRICLRELAHNGQIPGMTKSSW